ncbi:MAG: hypothetical protein HYZ02_02910, partial [Candidatus Levybacteria bacterium]|nr:hypothetical protein [Candidatus Levybacteria bacterium]
SYTRYFNTLNERVGPLFQGVFKSVHVETDEQLLHLSRYIHLNPLKVNSAINFIDFSSYLYYLGHKKASWVKPEEILSFFRSAKRQDLQEVSSYQSFVEDYLEDSSEILGSLVIEDDVV